MFIVGPVVGTGLTTLLALLALAASNGTVADIVERIRRVDSDVLITASSRNSRICDFATLTEELRAAPHVEAVAPYRLVPQVMVGVETGDQPPAFILLKGVSRRDEALATALATEASAEAIARLDDPGIPLLMGASAAMRLRLQTGDQVVLTQKDPIADRHFLGTIVGVFHGDAGFESTSAYTSLEGARRILNMPSDCVSGIAIKTDAPLRAREFAVIYSRLVGSSYSVRDWTTLFEGYWSSLSLLRKLVAGLDGVVVVVGVGFSLLSVLLIAHDRRREAAVLATLGMSDRQVRSIFVVAALTLVSAGMLTAVVLAAPISWFMNHYRVIRLTDATAVVSFVSFRIELLDSALLCLSQLLLSVAYTWWLMADVTKLPVGEILVD